MPDNQLIKLAKYGYLTIAGLMALLGAAMLLKPALSLDVLCRLGGWTLIAFGAVKLTGYCSRDLYRLAFQHDLAAGLLIITLGVILLLRSRQMLHMVIALLGFCILADGFLKLQIAVDSRAFGLGRWRRILCTAVLTGIVGGVLVCRPAVGAEVTVRLLGAALVLEAVLNVATISTAVKIIRQRSAD